MFKSIGLYYFREQKVSGANLLAAQKDFNIGKPKVRTVLPEGVNFIETPEGDIKVPIEEHGKIHEHVIQNLNDLYKESLRK